MANANIFLQDARSPTAHKTDILMFVNDYMIADKHN